MSKKKRVDEDEDDWGGDDAEDMEDYESSPPKSSPSSSDSNTLRTTLLELHDRRQAAIARVKELDFGGSAEAQLKNSGLLRTPFPPVPTSLYGLLSVIVPGETDREVWGDQTVSVRWDQTTHSMYGDNVVPVLADMNLNLLDGDSLSAVFAYVNAYCAYLSDLVAMNVNRLDTFEKQLSQFNAEAIILYSQGGKITTVVKAQIKLDPFNKELVKAIGTQKAILRLVTSWLETARGTASTCSRLLTHLHTQQSMAFGGYQGHQGNRQGPALPPSLGGGWRGNKGK
jgi:hypothetical protein